MGSKSFVETIKEMLGVRAKGRKVVQTESSYQLREAVADYLYRSDFNPENDDLRPDNRYLWDNRSEKRIGA